MCPIITPGLCKIHGEGGNGEHKRKYVTTSDQTLRHLQVTVPYKSRREGAYLGLLERRVGTRARPGGSGETGPGGGDDGAATGASGATGGPEVSERTCFLFLQNRTPVSLRHT